MLPPRLTWSIYAGILAGWALASASPSFNFTFTPHLRNASAYSLDAEMVFAAPDLGAGEVLVTMYLWVAGIPTQRYDGDALAVTDADGLLPLTTSEEGTEGVLQIRSWTTARATNGDVTLRYAIHPRVLKGDEWGPLFDTRSQTGGLIGSLIECIPFPPDQAAINTITEHWDLSDSPDGTRVATSLGEVTYPHTFNATSTDFLFSLWAVGNLSSYPETADTDFAMYWFDEPVYNTSEVGEMIRNFYDIECGFFNQTSDVGYHVFLRTQNSVGGTAMHESFVYSNIPEDNRTTLEHEYILAHEISHNFLEFDDDVVNSTTISEGWAEYYSLRVLWRNGLITDQEYLDAMNSRAEYYYTSPYVNLSDAQVQDDPWGDKSLQKIPYGRGLIYLSNTDAQMRERYGGAKSLDTLTMGMIERRQQGLPHGLGDWFDLLREYLGESAVDEYKTAATGSPLIRLAAGTLSPCFEVVQTGSDPVVDQWRFSDARNWSCII